MARQPNPPFLPSDPIWDRELRKAIEVIQDGTYKHLETKQIKSFLELIKEVYRIAENCYEVLANIPTDYLDELIFLASLMPGIILALSERDRNDGHRRVEDIIKEFDKYLEQANSFFKKIDELLPPLPTPQFAQDNQDKKQEAQVTIQQLVNSLLSSSIFAERARQGAESKLEQKATTTGSYSSDYEQGPHG